MFEKDMRYSLLLDFYGELLSDRRRELIELYYNDDLSLSEISELTGISRQGVRDSVKKSENELLDFENKLGLAARFEKIGSELKAAEAALRIISENCGERSKEILSIADSIAKINL